MAIRDELNDIKASVRSTEVKMDTLIGQVNVHLRDSTEGKIRLTTVCDALKAHLDNHKQGNCCVVLMDTSRKLIAHLTGHRLFRKFWVGILTVLVGAAILGVWNSARTRGWLGINGHPQKPVSEERRSP